MSIQISRKTDFHLDDEVVFSDPLRNRLIGRVVRTDVAFQVYHVKGEKDEAIYEVNLNTDDVYKIVDNDKEIEYETKAGEKKCYRCGSSREFPGIIAGKNEYETDQCSEVFHAER